MRKMLAAMVAAVLLSACGVNTSPGDGEKIGQVVQLRKQGLFCKTWEGQIVRGGFSNGSGANGTAYDFTVPDDATAEKVKQYMQDQTEVVITYRMEGVYSLCRSDNGGHFLASINPAPTKPKPTAEQ